VNRRTYRLVSFIIAIATILTAGGGLGSALVVRVDQTPLPEELQPLPTLANLPPTSIVQLPPTSTLAPPPPPPPGAQPVGAVDLAIRQQPQGIAGDQPGEVSCDSPGVMRIKTASGTLLAGINQDGGWSCQATLTQWRSVAQQDADLGARYRPAEAGRPGNLVLVNGFGRSFSLAVTGAWAAQ
jgi:hypothetical protein